ncbi:hypothetical protein RDWZM_006978 [Blomia tropicalis]|uniref:Uncharacterized protein n=1 Tax=Blomia tropicalis TaxID=40697 RepID=A0A9Q0RNX2_BLOTA|nr:hypothetical protein RDWZM_006978 [Blomia tropicalis]
MFKNEGHLEDGKLRKTHEIVKSILESNFSTLVFDRFKSQLLPQAMAIIKSKIDSGKTNYIETLKQTWEVLYKQILPTLDCMLHQIETPKGLSLRKASLIVFRDHVLLVEPLEERLRSEIENGTKICDTIIHMILTVQDVCECFPPSKNKLEMERICALVVSPFLGYRGLFVNGDNTNPIVRSNEPELHAKPRSLEPITNSNQSVKLCVQAMLNAANDQKISSRSPEPSKESKPIGKKQSSFTNLNYLMARIYK